MEARGVVDAIGFELALHELLSAALRESSVGEELCVELGDVRDDRATVRLVCVPPRRPVSAAAELERLSVIARQLRGSLDVSAQMVTLAIPVQRTDAVDQTTDVPAVVPVAAAADVRSSAVEGSAGREASHDLRGSRERNHGETSSL
jgi:hypothetical protein